MENVGAVLAECLASLDGDAKACDSASEQKYLPQRGPAAPLILRHTDYS